MIRRRRKRDSGHRPAVGAKKRLYVFLISPDLADGLKALKARDGVLC